MDDDWESAAEKELVVRPKIANMNKWDGEDDDEDVKESWEDEEEKKDEEKSETKTVPAKPKPNKVLKAKLAEEERLAEEAEEKRLADMTPEEKLAEKLRLQEIQKEADLKSALETFGVTSIGDNIINLNPETKEEFKEFAATLSWKVTQYKESPHFEQLVEDLVRSICANMTAADIKKVKISVDNMHSEKLKIEKQTKKPGPKGKGRATIRTENDDIETYRTYGDDFGGDEYDDFM